MTPAQLQELSKQRIGNVDKANLVDIQTIEIIPAKSIAHRMKDYLEEIKNPYYFRCGNTPVKISFSDNGKPLSQKLEEHFIRRKM